MVILEHIVMWDIAIVLRTVGHQVLLLGSRNMFWELKSLNQVVKLTQ
ncbi:Uncharacterised protein [Mycobacterium tuberculosis]|nr:Uncharacterised protein [Mycobacterium tuberculosis]